MALAAATALCAGKAASEEDLALARSLFDAVGRTVVVPESALDAVTGLSGSGPAYVMLFIEALADGGVHAGLPRDVALLLAAQTVYGAAKLQLESGEHPAAIKDRVTSPGGTTMAGLGRLEADGVRGSIIHAVEAATRRARELGK
jgi:pyrroline-5-carboxylate reductase